MKKTEIKEDKLDEDFLFYLSQARQAKKITDDYEKAMCEAWLQKLCGEHSPHRQTKRIRNAYLAHLVMGMQEGKLEEIFKQAPPAGKLRPIEEVFGMDCGKTATEPAWLQTIAAGTAKDFIHSSEDGRTYLATRYLDNGEGAFAYFALSLADEDPLFMQKKQTKAPESLSPRDQITQPHKYAPASIKPQANLPDSSKLSPNLPDSIKLSSNLPELPTVSPSATKKPRIEVPPPMPFTPANSWEAEQIPTENVQQQINMQNGRKPMPQMKSWEVEGIPTGLPSPIEPNVAWQKGTSSRASPIKQTSLLQPPDNCRCEPTFAERSHRSYPSDVSSKYPSVPSNRYPQAKPALPELSPAYQSEYLPHNESSQPSDSETLPQAEPNHTAEKTLSPKIPIPEATSERITEMYRELIQNIDDVLEGKDSMNSEVFRLYRETEEIVREDPQLQYIMEMPASDILRKLLILIRRKLIQRVHSVSPMSDYQEILDMELSAISELHEQEEKLPDTSKAMWHETIMRRLKPRNMKLLQNLYHEDVNTLFLDLMEKERVKILENSRDKYINIISQLKSDIEKEVKLGYEKYQKVRDELSQVVQACNDLKTTLHIDQDDQHQDSYVPLDQTQKLEHAKLTMTMQAECSEAEARYKYENKRAQKLCEQVEAEKERLSLVEAMNSSAIERLKQDSAAYRADIEKLAREIELEKQRIREIEHLIQITEVPPHTVL